MVITHSQTRSNMCIVRCDGCLMDVSSCVWIHCSVCQIDICPLCVFQKIQIHAHEFTHPYRVARSLFSEADFPNWQILEELLFVDGTVIYGIGNWEDIAKYVGRKDPEEIRAHFHEVYHIQDSRELEGPPSTDTHSNPLSQEISGYMPLRQDFEVEYSNEAELPIREMTISKADTQLEKDMKEALLDGYRLVLHKRQVFKHLVLRKGLLAAKALLSAERSLCSAGKELFHKVKPLLKVLTKEEFVSFFQGLYLESLIKKKIKSLTTIQIETQKRPELTKKPSPAEDTLLHDLFSPTEKTLCQTLAIPLGIYLLLKETAVLCTSPESARKALTKTVQGLSDYKLAALTNFFAQNHWIEHPRTEQDLQGISKDKNF
ncbi:hypothetical protein NECID01_0376 [Nematocida sp. AWRm77]|nr:hypothetical protein NECID01_0376 [Nematocida sp. AWRm77]